MGTHESNPVRAAIGMFFPKKPECTFRNNPHNVPTFYKVTKMVTENSQLLLPSVNIYSKYIETVKLKSLPSVTQ